MENSKSQTLNSKQITNSNFPNSKQYNLEERTFKFAKDCRDYVKKLPRTISNIEYGKQLIKSSGSQAANYIEANESLSKKDFKLRIKISKKETKESRLWLKLTEPTKENQTEQERLIQEANELMRIFGSIVENSK
ncbi:MAG: four helix bundle protein [Microgenomates group bacterium]